MKLIRIDQLLLSGPFSASSDWVRIEREIREGIAAVHWPPGKEGFTIYPQVKGNGVKPMKDGMMTSLSKRGWSLEVPLDLATRMRPGKLDAVCNTEFGPFAVEWETGNISSSHRAINKMALGLVHKKLAGGLLIVPSRKLYRYLTDRVGNVAELEPYYEVWRAIPIENGMLGLAVVEHDGESTDVPRITKGTDGRALA
jgi:hypothetical protein